MESARKAMGISPKADKGVVLIGPLLRRGGITKARVVKILVDRLSRTTSAIPP
jgi:hypothetical protein